MSFIKNLCSVVWNCIESVVYFFVYKVFRMKLNESKWKLIIQVIKFGIVGISNTVVSYLIYVGTLLIQQHLGLFPRFDYIVSQVVAFLLSVLWSFFWNRIFVFEAKEISLAKALLRTYISYAFTGLILSNIMLTVWINVLHIDKLVAPLINLVFSIPINFLLNKYWSFGK